MTATQMKLMAANDTKEKKNSPRKIPIGGWLGWATDWVNRQVAPLTEGKTHLNPIKL